MCRISWNIGILTSWNPLGHTGPVTGLHTHTGLLHESGTGDRSPTDWQLYTHNRHITAILYLIMPIFLIFTHEILYLKLFHNSQFHNTVRCFFRYRRTCWDARRALPYYLLAPIYPITYWRLFTLITYWRLFTLINYWRIFTLITYWRSLTLITYWRSFTLITYWRSFTLITYWRLFTLITYWRLFTLITYWRLFTLITHWRLFTR